MNEPKPANQQPEAIRDDVLDAWAAIAIERAQQGAGHLRNNSQPPSSSNVSACTMDTAAPMDNGADRSGPNCNRANCASPSQVETRPMPKYCFGWAFMNWPLIHISVICAFTFSILLEGKVDANTALLVFSLSVIVVLTMGAIALTAMIRVTRANHE